MRWGRAEWWVCMVALVVGQQVEQLTLEEPTAEQSLLKNSYAYFSVKIPEEVEDFSQTLVLDAYAPAGEVYDPDIFVSVLHQYPTREMSEWKCRAFGEDICLVPKESLKHGAEVHVTIYCEKACKYYLLAIVRPEILLKAGERRKDSVRENESKLYLCQVPESPNTRSIAFSLDLGTSNTTMVRMMVSKSSMPSAENTLAVFPSWLGLSARVYKDAPTEDFCTNCSYSILVNSKTSTRYSLSCSLSDGVVKVRDIEFETNDLVAYLERNCYEYRVREANTSLEVLLNVYSGNPNVYVNPGVLPMGMDEFAFKSEGHLNEQLSISAADRRARNAEVGPYYICIHGMTASAYNLMIYSKGEGGDYIMPIHSGLTRTMGLGPRILSLFRFPVEAVSDCNITFTLVSIMGSADLFVRKCTWDSACALDRSNLMGPEVLRSTSTSSIAQLSVNLKVSNPPIPNRNDPAIRNKQQTYFLIGVMGRTKSVFSLTVMTSESLELPLAEGMPYVGTLELKHNSSFSFVVKDPRVNRVQIQLTSLNGDSDLYVARNNPLRDANHAEKVSAMNSYLPDTVIYTKQKDGPLNSTYYVLVHGHTASMFSLVYQTTIEKKTGVVRLLNGVPLTGVMEIGEAQMRYQFDVALNPLLKLPITIELSYITGKYSVYVSADSEPSQLVFHWVFGNNQHSLIISPSDPEYRHEGRYNVLVMRESEELSMFTIKYMTGTYSTRLAEGVPILGNITNSQPVHYQFEAVSAPLLISVTPLSGDPDLYISLNSSNCHPSSNRYDLKSVSLGADSIEVTQQDLNKWKATTVYIAVVCESSQCIYSLQVARSGLFASQLAEGVPEHGRATKSIPKYHYAILARDTMITITPRSGSVVVYANVVALPILKHSTGHFPTIDKHDCVSQTQAGIERIVVFRSQHKACESPNQCAVYIGVFMDEKVRDLDQAEYSVLMHGEAMWLAEGQTVVDEILQGQYRLYQFQVPCLRCTLSISLTPLSDGDPDLFVSKGVNMEPSKNVHDFNSTSAKGEFLQIAPTNPYFSNSLQPFMGEYTIAVYGNTNCTYSLSASTRASLLQELIPGLPSSTEIAAGEQKYFVFHGWKSEDIRVSTSVKSGRVLLRASVIKSLREENVISKLPASEEKCTWSSFKSNSNHFLTIRKSDPFFLRNGVYLIAVEAAEDSALDLTVEYRSGSDIIHLKYGHPYRTQMAAGESLTLAFIVSSYENVYVSLSTKDGTVIGRVSTDLGGVPYHELQSFFMLTLSPLDHTFRTGPHYVFLNAKSDAEVTLTITQSQRIVTLGEGIPLADTLQEDSPRHYMYRVPHQMHEQLKETLLNVYAVFSGPIKDARIFVRKITREDFALPTEENAQYSFNYSHELNQVGGAISLSHRQAQTLLLSLRGGSTTASKYTIVAWTTGIIVMNPYHTYTNSFSKPNQIHSYELPVHSKSRIYIEVAPCIGNVEFFVTKELSKIYDREYDLKESDLRRGRIFGAFNAEPGVYYVSVRDMSASDVHTIYTIRSLLSNSSDVTAIDEYYLEDYGNLEVRLDGQQLAMSWGKVYARESRKAVGSGVQYFVYIAEEGKANMMSACGIKMGGSLMLAQKTDECSLQCKVPDQWVGKKSVLNVIATVPTYSQSFTYTPVYVVVERRGVWSYVIMAVACVAILGLLVMAFYYWKRSRDTERRIEYEVTGGRDTSRVQVEEQELPELKSR